MWSLEVGRGEKQSGNLGQSEKYKKIKSNPRVNILYTHKMKKAFMTFTEDCQSDGTDCQSVLKNCKYTGIVIPWKKVTMIAIWEELK